MSSGNKCIVANDAETGKRIWIRRDGEAGEVLPTTLCVRGRRIFFQGPGHLVCHDAKSGEALWQAARPVRRDRLSWSTPTVVAYEDVVLSADCAAPADTSGSVKWTVTAKPKRGDDGAGELVAFAAKDGRELWRCKAAQGYTSPVDLFVAGYIQLEHLTHRHLRRPARNNMTEFARPNHQNPCSL